MSLQIMTKIYPLKIRSDRQLDYEGLQFGRKFTWDPPWDQGRATPADLAGELILGSNLSHVLFCILAKSFGEKKNTLNIKVLMHNKLSEARTQRLMILENFL